MQNHQQNKIETKCERDMGRIQMDNECAIICFDFENVLTLPRANIKSFFFNRKLSVFNLTAHGSVGKAAGYCAIWCEGLRGRAGNDISSALIAILERILHDNANISKIVL